MQTHSRQIALQLQDALLGRQIRGLRGEPLDYGLQRQHPRARGELLRLRLCAAGIRTRQRRGRAAELVERLARAILLLGQRVWAVHRQVPFSLQAVDLELRFVVLCACCRFQVLEGVVAELRHVGQCPGIACGLLFRIEQLAQTPSLERRGAQGLAQACRLFARQAGALDVGNRALIQIDHLRPGLGREVLARLHHCPPASADVGDAQVRTIRAGLGLRQRRRHAHAQRANARDECARQGG